MEFRGMFSRMTGRRAYSFVQTHYLDKIPRELFNWVEIGHLENGSAVPSEAFAEFLRDEIEYDNPDTGERIYLAAMRALAERDDYTRVMNFGRDALETLRAYKTANGIGKTHATVTLPPVTEDERRGTGEAAAGSSEPLADDVSAVPAQEIARMKPQRIPALIPRQPRRPVTRTGTVAPRISPEDQEIADIRGMIGKAYLGTAMAGEKLASLRDRYARSDDKARAALIDEIRDTLAVASYPKNLPTAEQIVKALWFPRKDNLPPAIASPLTAATTFAGAIEALVQSRPSHLSVTEIASKWGETRGAVDRWRRGERHPRYGLALILAYMEEAGLKEGARMHVQALYSNERSVIAQAERQAKLRRNAAARLRGRDPHLAVEALATISTFAEALELLVQNRSADLSVDDLRSKWGASKARLSVWRHGANLPGRSKEARIVSYMREIGIPETTIQHIHALYESEKREKNNESAAVRRAAMAAREGGIRNPSTRLGAQTRVGKHMEPSEISEARGGGTGRESP